MRVRERIEKEGYIKIKSELEETFSRYDNLFSNVERPVSLIVSECQNAHFMSRYKFYYNNKFFIISCSFILYTIENEFSCNSVSATMQEKNSEYFICHEESSNIKDWQEKIHKFITVVLQDSEDIYQQRKDIQERRKQKKVLIEQMTEHCKQHELTVEKDYLKISLDKLDDITVGKICELLEFKKRMEQ